MTAQHINFIAPLNTQTLQWIEKQLDLELPHLYAHILSEYPFAPTSFAFVHDLWGDARTIVESNLLLREEFSSFWTSHFLAIGRDDVGGVYFLDTHIPDSPVFSTHTGECADAKVVNCEQEAESLTQWIELIG
jgi:hypothetical protein